MMSQNAFYHFLYLILFTGVKWCWRYSSTWKSVQESRDCGKFLRHHPRCSRWSRRTSWEACWSETHLQNGKFWP